MAAAVNYESPAYYTDTFGTDEMTLNMGPQHPSTHGVIRFILKTDGEVMRRAIPDIGYLHRSIEKIGEKVSWHGFMPFTDRADYLASMCANQAYAVAVERLANLTVPPRAEYLRVIASEFNRIISHLLALGALALDMGAFTPFLYAIRERETVNDLLEALCGARLTYNYVRIGGVAQDMPKDFRDRCMAFLDHFEPKIIDEFNLLISENEIFIKRLANVAPITHRQAIAYGLVGPNLRGSGVKYDLRKDEPYSIYPELDFEVPVGTGHRGTIGDCLDRYWVRVEEMRQSAKILRQCFAKMPQGEIIGKVARTLKPQKGDVYVRTESARGEMGFFVVSDANQNGYRVKIRTGSFTAMSIIDPISRGLMIADLVALIGSLDVVAPEIDR